MNFFVYFRFFLRTRTLRLYLSTGRGGRASTTILSTSHDLWGRKCNQLRTIFGPKTRISGAICEFGEALFGSARPFESKNSIAPNRVEGSLSQFGKTLMIKRFFWPICELLGLGSEVDTSDSKNSIAPSRTLSQLDKKRLWSKGFFRRFVNFLSFWFSGYLWL